MREGGKTRRRNDEHDISTMANQEQRMSRTRMNHEWSVIERRRRRPERGEVIANEMPMERDGRGIRDSVNQVMKP